MISVRHQVRTSPTAPPLGIPPAGSAIADSLPALNLSRIENYDHFVEDLEHANEDWIHECAPKAFQLSIGYQYNSPFTLDKVKQLFNDVFPFYYNAWQDEEVARILLHPGMGVLRSRISLGIVRVTDLRPSPIGGRQDRRHHWVGMKYQPRRPVPDSPPPKARATFIPPPNNPLPVSLYRLLLNAVTGVERSTQDLESYGGSSYWANFDTAEGFAIKSVRPQQREQPRSQQPQDFTAEQLELTLMLQAQQGRGNKKTPMEDRKARGKRKGVG
ncbi:hypothetical protein SBOR_7481 [Sclerotinia borealis F-4128]|uniref:Uncharacterized protein n=1 Tax=Sclerotinia borealis (strain F-4128) TaxID=1432307 RepID=W9CB95_SCLBF|nr:hypothetical protein SBOR_7481 [Sclerotinia borealis F-4128]